MMRLTRIVTRIDHRVDTMPQRILPGHQTRPCWRAVRRAGIGLSKLNTFAGEPVDVRCFGKRIPRKAHVAPSHIIDQNEDDVWPLQVCGMGRMCENSERDECRKPLDERQLLISFGEAIVTNHKARGRASARRVRSREFSEG